MFELILLGVDTLKALLNGYFLRFLVKRSGFQEEGSSPLCLMRRVIRRLFLVGPIVVPFFVDRVRGVILV